MATYNPFLPVNQQTQQQTNTQGSQTNPQGSQTGTSAPATTYSYAPSRGTGDVLVGGTSAQNLAAYNKLIQTPEFQNSLATAYNEYQLAESKYRAYLNGGGGRLTLDYFISQRPKLTSFISEMTKYRDLGYPAFANTGRAWSTSGAGLGATLTGVISDLKRKSNITIPLTPPSTRTPDAQGATGAAPPAPFARNPNDAPPPSSTPPVQPFVQQPFQQQPFYGGTAGFSQQPFQPFVDRRLKGVTIYFLSFLMIPSRSTCITFFG